MPASDGLPDKVPTLRSTKIGIDVPQAGPVLSDCSNSRYTAFRDYDFNGVSMHANICLIYGAAKLEWEPDAGGNYFLSVGFSAVSLTPVSLTPASLFTFIAVYSLVGFMGAANTQLPYAKAISSQFNARRVFGSW